MSAHDQDGVDGEPREYWEGRYGESEHLWSGRANAALVFIAAGLEPGTALDLGCGEGADAVWLARNGWRVTGLDVSETALGRAAELARERGVADRVDWRRADLASWVPSERHDLVSACFLHSPLDGFDRVEVLRRAADAVADGGNLLVVGHAAPPPWSEAARHGDHRFHGPDEELRGLALDAGAWETEVAEARGRTAAMPDGTEVEVEDSVVLLRRR